MSDALNKFRTIQNLIYEFDGNITSAEEAFGDAENEESISFLINAQNDLPELLTQIQDIIVEIRKDIAEQAAES